MSRINYTVLPIDIGNQPGQYIVPKADVEPGLPPAPDKDFRELWVLQGSVASLRGRRGNRLVQGTAPLTWHGNYLSIAGGGGNFGLSLPWNDTVVGTTMWIAKRPALGVSQIVGGSQTNAGDITGGSSPSWSPAGDLLISSRGITQSTIAAGMAVGDFYAVIVSHSLTERVALLSGGTPLTTAGTKIAATPARPNGVGNNGGYTTSPFVLAGIDVAGCVDWAEPKDEDDCMDLIGQYARWFASLQDPVAIYNG